MRKRYYSSSSSLLLFLSTNHDYIGVASCSIHNTQSGICTKKYLPSTYSSKEGDLAAIQQAKAHWQNEMPFCGKWIANYYSPCVPSRPTRTWLEADGHFPFGRLSSDDGEEDVYSVRTKDAWVEETVSITIQARIEMGKKKGRKHFRFHKNKDCQEAYARYSCWLNFPRCDEFEESLPLCQSACENLFRVCGFATDIWRCDVNVVDGEEDGGEDTRAFFPGQPFQKNEFYPKRSGDPKAVCTPSIKGSAHSRGGVRAWRTVLIIVCLNSALLQLAMV